MAIFDFDIFRWETSYQLNNLGHYLNLMETQLTSVKDKAKASLPILPPNADEEEHSIWQAEINFHEEIFKRDFPNKLRYSFLILLHSIFETRLKETCDEITRRKELDLKEKDLKGSQIKRADIFLKKIAKISNCKSRDSMHDLQKVRDCIVHCGGNVERSRDKKHLLKLAERSNWLSVKNNILQIKREFCNYMIYECTIFFDDLHNASGFNPFNPIMKKSDE